MAKQDHEYGVGERTDGTIDVFPESELQQRLAEWRAKQAGETDEDDLGDLGEIEKLFGEPAPEAKKPKAERLFKVTPPKGEPFYAALLSDGRVASNRDGKWGHEAELSPGDLADPETLDEGWSVEEIHKGGPLAA
jgi:hypothetical protein